MAEPHWTEVLFLKHADLFLEVHKAGVRYAETQVAQLEGILESLGVRSLGKLLDAPCGIGRHSLSFAARGWEVVGVDFSPLFVEKAWEAARTMGFSGNVRFLQGDLRHVRDLLKDQVGTFRVILNLFTSLGYWDEATDLAILRQFHDLARPGGLLIVDTINRDYVVKHFDPLSQETYGDLVYVESRRFDYDASRVESNWAFYDREGEDLRHRASIHVSTRAYAAHELRQLLLDAGWAEVQVHSGWSLGPVSPDQYRIMAVGKRQG